MALRVKYTEKKVRALDRGMEDVLRGNDAVSWYAIFNSFCCSGARKQEAIHAEKSDVDFVNDRVIDHPRETGMATERL